MPATRTGPYPVIRITPPPGNKNQFLEKITGRLEHTKEGLVLRCYMSNPDNTWTDDQLRRDFAEKYQMNGLPPMNFGVEYEIYPSPLRKSDFPNLRLYDTPDWWNNLLEEEAEFYTREMLEWKRPVDEICLAQIALLLFPTKREHILRNIKNAQHGTHSSATKAARLYTPKSTEEQFKKSNNHLWVNPEESRKYLVGKKEGFHHHLKDDKRMWHNYNTATYYGNEPGEHEASFLDILNEMDIHPDDHDQLPPEWFLHHPEALEQKPFPSLGYYSHDRKKIHAVKNGEWLRCPRQKRALKQLLSAMDPTLCKQAPPKWLKKVAMAGTLPPQWENNPEVAILVIKECISTEMAELLKKSPGMACALETENPLKKGEESEESIKLKIHFADKI